MYHCGINEDEECTKQRCLVELFLWVASLIIGIISKWTGVKPDSTEVSFAYANCPRYVSMVWLLMYLYGRSRPSDAFEKYDLLQRLNAILYGSILIRLLTFCRDGATHKLAASWLVFAIIVVCASGHDGRTNIFRSRPTVSTKRSSDSAL